MTDRTLARVQAVSGLVFAVFLLLHLGGALVALLGQGAFDAWIRAARGYYQLPVVEVLGEYLGQIDNAKSSKRLKHR